jgi:hypothetical protein
MRISKENVMRHAMELANNAIKDMGIERGEWLICKCDLLDPEHIMELLLDKASPVMVVAGDWRDNKDDVYDVVVRFAEDHFRRIRHKKYPIGTYVVIMSDQISCS